MTNPTVTSRYFNKKDDFEQVMKFLAEICDLENLYLHWLPSGFENEVFNDKECEKRIRLWERIDQSNGNEKSKIVALLILASSPYRYYSYVDPDFKFLQSEINTWAERKLKKTKGSEEEGLEIRTFALGDDKECIAILEQQGYQNGGLVSYPQTRPVGTPIPKHNLPAGFIIRNIQGEEDYPKAVKTIAVVFDHEEFTEAVYKLMAKTSFYNQELDLVAIDPDGTVAAFCMIRIDPFSKIAEIAPVGTHPKYRRRGLAKTLLSEGLHRAKKYRPSVFFVESAPTEEATQLYEKFGFTNKKELYRFLKTI